MVSDYAVIVVEMTADQMEVIDIEALEHPWTGPKAVSTDKDGEGGKSSAKGQYGLPDGIPGGTVRFTRLQHNGADWDLNVELSADRLMLQEFHLRSGGIPVASGPESVRIEQLQHFPKKGAPPFIYVTGRRPFSVDARQALILKEYLLERGGFIIGDSPGDAFYRSFRGMISRVLVNQAVWTTIPNDDEIYRRPCSLPNGAPPLWHHDGYSGQGIKVNGRWVVFFHPGDMGDAWKAGNSGTDPETYEAAYDMGANLMYYALWHYGQFHRGKY